MAKLISGASIFVPANTILVEAAKELGLEVEGKMFVYDEDDDDSIGMYFSCSVEMLITDGTARNSSSRRNVMRITTGALSSLSPDTALLH